MKKVFAVVILIIVGVSSYMVWKAGRETGEESFVMEERVVFTPDEADHSEESEEEAISPADQSNQAGRISGAASKAPERSLTPTELAALEANFDKVEKEWALAMDNLFTNELNLSADTLAEYEKLREAYDQDKYQAFQEYHQKMLEKYGENYQYNPTEQMEEFENTVLQNYQNKLKELIGEEGMKQYLHTLDTFNERLMRDQDPNQGAILIDY